MSQIGDRRNSETIMTVEEGEERRRAAVLQDIMTIAFTDSDCGTAREPIFEGNVSTENELNMYTHYNLTFKSPPCLWHRITDY